MDLSIIIVSWKVKDLLKKCLASIYGETKSIKFEVFVVDNYSEDGTVEMVKNEFSKVKLIANQENVGFAGACNQAFQEAKGDFVLLLNPDTEIIENALEKMIGFMKENPQAGVASCQLLNPDRTLQPSVRRFPTFSATALYLLKLHHLFPNLKTLRNYLAKDFDYSKTQEVDQVMGAFFLIRYDTIRKVGLLDKNFYVWFEEVDYCQRVKKLGWKVIYTPKAKIIHHFGQSFQQVLGLKKQIWFNNSCLRYSRKHRPSIEYFGLLIIYPIGLFLAFLAQIFAKKT